MAEQKVSGATAPEEAGSARRLAILLAMAMFVLVVDTSVMNVSISAVVHDLHTTVSSVQSAIALEALVSAAFILIGSKVGDAFGRKRAYVLGLLGYAIGALAMALAQSLTAVIVFWAIIGGLGASLLLCARRYTWCAMLRGCSGWDAPSSGAVRRRRTILAWQFRQGIGVSRGRLRCGARLIGCEGSGRCAGAEGPARVRRRSRPT